MGPRIYFPIYYRGLNWNYVSQLINRYYPTRHLLRSRTFSLRSIYRGSICYFWGICTLIPIIHRSQPSRTMGQNTFYNYIYWSKRNILPTTFFRIKRDTSAVLRLPRCHDKMECYLINRVYTIICCASIIYLYIMRSTHKSAQHGLCKTPADFVRMTRPSSVRLP